MKGKGFPVQAHGIMDVHVQIRHVESFKIDMKQTTGYGHDQYYHPLIAATTSRDTHDVNHQDICRMDSRMMIQFHIASCMVTFV